MLSASEGGLHALCPAVACHDQLLHLTQRLEADHSHPQKLHSPLASETIHQQTSQILFGALSCPAADSPPYSTVRPQRQIEFSLKANVANYFLGLQNSSALRSTSSIPLPAFHAAAKAATSRPAQLQLLSNPALNGHFAGVKAGYYPIDGRPEPIQNAPSQDSSSQSEDSTNPTSAKVDSRSGQPSQDEDGFIDIQHEDLEMQDSGSNAAVPPQNPSSDFPGLQRLSHSDKAEEVPEEEDDSEDEHDIMANHPLLGMLTGRLGQRRRGSSHKWDRLHPENQALSVANVDQCSSLEEEAFPAEERASREKFQYRLTRCPELSLGLFTQPTKAEMKNSSSPPQRRLIGHVVSTRSPAPSVTEASMGVPSNWKTRRSSLPSSDDEEPLGHQDMGGTICVHSLAVAPEFQRMGLGSVLMKSYIQRMKDSKIANRLALLTHDHLVPFYMGLGFENMGPSAVTSHGGNWNNMVTHLTTLAEVSDLTDLDQILEFNHEDDD